MNSPSSSSETLHASCVAKEGRAILISGPSGSGKSDLALRLIDRGAILVSDDYTIVSRFGGQLLASAPSTIEGKIEVRGVGILQLPTARDAPVALFVDLEREVERLPSPHQTITIGGVEVPVIAANALEASTPVKVEAALRHIGLKA
ncbi:MAG TPA: HPr kinase/phosphatase C-terminal domain-containing protein [Allosphingosinicella sp.]|nr:HPr kinase/phosphatase C-terminal domain-containing protein [Allosphingosinicella sp.]